MIERIPNALNVHFDPSSIQPDYSDAEYAIVVDSISKDEFKARWPKASDQIFRLSTCRQDGHLATTCRSPNTGTRSAHRQRCIC